MSEDDRWREVEKRLERKFIEIETHIAAALGYGSLGHLTLRERADVAQEALRATEEWTIYEVENFDYSELANSQLQELLAEYFQISEEILDLRDESSDNED